MFQTLLFDVVDFEPILHALSRNNLVTECSVSTTVIICSPSQFSSFFQVYVKV